MNNQGNNTQKLDRKRLLEFFEKYDYLCYYYGVHIDSKNNQLYLQDDETERCYGLPSFENRSLEEIIV